MWMSSEHKQMTLDRNVSHTLRDQKFGQDGDTWLEKHSFFVFFHLVPPAFSLQKVNDQIPMSLKIKKAYISIFV